MSFKDAIDAHPDGKKLDEWVTALQDEVNGCAHTANNLGRCKNFPVGDPPTDDDLTSLAQRLPAPGPLPPKQTTKGTWLAASNGTPPQPGVCVACGKDITTTSPARLVRTQVLAGLHRHVLPAFTEQVGSPEFARFLQANPAGTNALRPMLQADATVRSSVRSAFWADGDAVDGFRAINSTAKGLRRYLGIDDRLTGSGPPVLVLELNDPVSPAPKYPRKMPTGFDAVDNAFFAPQPPTATVGKTQNIVRFGQPGFQHPDTDEVVTREVLFADVNIAPAVIL